MLSILPRNSLRFFWIPGLCILLFSGDQPRLALMSRQKWKIWYAQNYPLVPTQYRTVIHALNAQCFFMSYNMKVLGVSDLAWKSDSSRLSTCFPDKHMLWADIQSLLPAELMKTIKNLLESLLFMCHHHMALGSHLCQRNELLFNQTLTQTVFPSTKIKHLYFCLS